MDRVPWNIHGAPGTAQFAAPRTAEPGIDHQVDPRPRLERSRCRDPAAIPPRTRPEKDRAPRFAPGVRSSGYAGRVRSSRRIARGRMWFERWRRRLRQPSCRRGERTTGWPRGRRTWRWPRTARRRAGVARRRGAASSSARPRHSCSAARTRRPDRASCRRARVQPRIRARHRALPRFDPARAPASIVNGRPGRRCDRRVSNQLATTSPVLEAPGARAAGPSDSGSPGPSHAQDAR